MSKINLNKGWIAARRDQSICANLVLVDGSP